MFADQLELLGRPAPHNWEFANATVRAAATYVGIDGVLTAYVSADLGKLALQLSDNSLWILTATTPTWVPVSGTGMSNPMTTPGDLIVGGASGVAGRLALGTSLQYLRVNSGGTALEFGSMGSNVPTFLATPTFANLLAAVTGATLFSSTTRSSALQAAQLVTLTSSSTDTFAGTAGVTATAYATGDIFAFKANFANTGAASLNVDTLGAKTIVKVVGGVTTALADNDIRVDQMVVVQYDGTNFQIQSTLGNSAGGDMLLGTSQTVTAAKTFNAGTLKIASGGDLVDANGNELFKFTATASAVNELTLANAAAGGSPTWTASGGSSDIGQNFVAKGLGKFKFTGGTNQNTYLQLDTSAAGFFAANNFLINAVSKAFVGVTGTAGGLSAGSAVGDLVLRSEAGNILLSTDSGTSAALKLSSLGQFTNKVHATQNCLAVFDTTDSSAFSLIRFAVAGSVKFDIGATTSSSVITGSVSGDAVMRTAGNLLVSADNGTTAHFKLTATTGAAIFSSSVTAGAQIVAPAATTSIPSFRAPHGTAPSSPTNGDIWTTTAGLFVRINGATVGPLS